MSSQSHHPTFQEDLLSDLEDLPLELFEEIASYLDIPTLKALSLISSVRRGACIRLFFHTLTLHGDHGHSSSSEFLADFKNQAPVQCLRKVVLEGLKEDLSKALLPWCTRVHSIKIKECLVGNTALLPSLIVLNDLELLNLTFGSVADYFSLLASLPSTLKKLIARGNTFRESQSIYHTVGRGIELEHLETKSAGDLSLLLRDDCPVSLKSLRVAHVPQARPHDLEVLLQKTPHLIDLRLGIATPEDRPVSLPLTRLKSLSITDQIKSAEPTIQLLSTPSDVPSTLDVLSFTCLLNGEFESLLIALSQPKFRNLKELNLQMIAPNHFPYRHRWSFFDVQVRQLYHRLEALGSKIYLRTRLVAPDPMDSDILRSFP